MPNLTKNIATRAAQRESLPNLTKILLPKLSKEITAAQRELLPKLTKILLLELIRNKNCCRVSPKYCCEKLPRENCCRISPKILRRELPRENCCRSSPKYCCQSRPEKLLPNLNKILLRKLPREKTWDDSWQNQSSQDRRWNQRLLNHSY